MSEYIRFINLRDLISWRESVSVKVDNLYICDPTPANEALCGKINVQL